MSKYFMLDYPGQFKMLSQSHVFIMLAIFVIVVTLYVFRKELREEKVNKFCRYSLAALLILQEISLNVWRLATGSWTIQESLPLHLCGIAIIASTIMLLTKKFTIYEVVYFWGMGGAIQAILTPNLEAYSFPHYRFFQFFVSHGLIVIACLYMTFVEQYRPKLKSIVKTMVVTNIYLAIIAVFNSLTGANYLFICEKPLTGSLLDVLGPWPWYVLSLEGVAVIIFLFFYLPFFFGDLLRKACGKHEPARL